MEASALSTTLRDRVASEVLERGHAILRKDELDELWGKTASPVARESLTRLFAEEIEAQLERCAEWGALLTRVEHDAQPRSSTGSHAGLGGDI